MDSKNKYFKNKNWRKKYLYRNTASAFSRQKLSGIKSESPSDQLQEYENKINLKQPLPKDGWFPTYDSTLRYSEGLNLPKNFQQSILIAKKDNYEDKKWFDKELDSIKLISKNDFQGKEKVFEENQNKVISVPTKIIEIELKHTNSKEIKSNLIKKLIKKNKIYGIVDNEDQELEFLLSLKEPVHSRPLNIKKNLKNERCLPINNSFKEQTSIKTNDLEKWLDSVIDN